MAGDKRQGTKAAAQAERGADLYETPIEATRALLRHVPLPLAIWEPAAGRGAIARVLAKTGRIVVASDLVRYAGADPYIQAPIDFFKRDQAPRNVRSIVTNPPFYCVDDFIRHGLRLVDQVIVLWRLAALQGEQRSDLIDRHLDRVLVGIERLPMMHREGWTGNKVDVSAVPFAWYVFRRQVRTGKRFQIERISWRGAP